MKALAFLTLAGASVVPTLSAVETGAPAPAGVTWQQDAPPPAVPAAAAAGTSLSGSSDSPPPPVVSPQRADVQRLERGGQVPPGWSTPRFIVRNWGLYGFPPPYPGLLWVRYYDDALLIDREGWVHDSRYEVDWARHGESWRTDRGVPEYALASEAGAGSYAYPNPADGFGYGFGQGLFYVPITITETTTVRSAPPKGNGPTARPGT